MGRGGLSAHFSFRVFFFFGGIETYYEEVFQANADGCTVISTALPKRTSDLGLLSVRKSLTEPVYSGMYSSSAGRTRNWLYASGMPVIRSFTIPRRLIIIERLVRNVRLVANGIIIISGTVSTSTAFATHGRCSLVLRSIKSEPHSLEGSNRVACVCILSFV
jgi:hypothetical protein